MKPISTCEKPSFEKLITGLTNDNFVPDRRIINNKLVNKYNDYVNDLIVKMSMQNIYLFNNGHLEFTEQELFGDDHALYRRKYVSAFFICYSLSKNWR